MSDTINFQPGTTVGEIIIVDGRSWTWDGKKWVLTDGFTGTTDLFVKREGDTMTGDLLLQDDNGDPAEYDDVTDPSTAVNKKYVDGRFLIDAESQVYFNNPDVDAYKMTYIHNPLNDQEFDTTINLDLFENSNLNGGHSITQCHKNTGLGYHCIHENYLQKILSNEAYTSIIKYGTFKLDFNGKRPGRSSYDQRPPTGAVWHYSGVAVVPGEANRLIVNNLTDLDGYCVEADGTLNVSYADAAKSGITGTIQQEDHKFTEVERGTYIRGTLKKVENPDVDGGYHHSLIEDETSPVFFSPIRENNGNGVLPKIYSVALRGVGPFTITYKTEKYSTNADVNQVEQDLISLDEEIESIIPSLERGQWEYKQSTDVGTQPDEGCYFLVKDYNPGDDITTATFTTEYKEATAVVFNNKQWAEDMSLAKDHEWDTVEVDELIDLLDKPDPDGLYGKITGVDTSSYTNAVIIAFNKVESLGSPSNNILSTLTRLKIFKEPTGDIPFFPVGVIMPYVGTSAPRGWLLCNGTTIPAEYTTLISMVGSSTPNLSGYFLGGAGGSGLSLNTRSTWKTGKPSSLTLSSSSGGSHSHSFSDSGTTSTIGDHSHAIGTTGNVDGNKSGGRFYPGSSGVSSGPAGSHSHTFSVSGTTGTHSGHTHTINSNNWDSYTRPYSYGVNYIIKHD